MRFSLSSKISFSALIVGFIIALPLMNANAQKSSLPITKYSENKYYPKADWETIKPSQSLDNLSKDALKPLKAKDLTLEGARAILIVKNGKIISEQYAAGYNNESMFNSWGMATSLSSVIAGVAINEKKIALDTKILNPFWKSGDKRNNISYRNLLNMNSGINWNEAKDAPQMLYAKGRENNLEYVSKKSQKSKAGEVWNYSTGSMTLLNASLAFNMGPRQIGDPTGKMKYRDYIFKNIFMPLGMENVALEFDASGNFYGGTYFNATARDYARLGLMIMRGGKWGDKIIYNKDFADFLITPINSTNYGGGLYLAPAGKATILKNKDYDAFYAKGQDGQLLIMVPKYDLILIRLGRLKETSGDEAEYFNILGDQMTKIIESAKN